MAAAPGIVPPYLLARIAAVQEEGWARAAEAARSTLAAPREYRPARSRLRLSIQEPGTLVAETTPAPDREISDAQQREVLPGVRVCGEDDPASGDASVDEAYDGLGATHDFWWDAYARDSLEVKRKVIQRLGWTTPSWISIGIWPGYCVSSSQRPSLPRLDSTIWTASVTRSSGVTPARRRYSSPRSRS